MRMPPPPIARKTLGRRRRRPNERPLRGKKPPPPLAPPLLALVVLVVGRCLAALVPVAVVADRAWDDEPSTTSVRRFLPRKRIRRVRVSSSRDDETALDDFGWSTQLRHAVESSTRHGTTVLACACLRGGDFARDDDLDNDGAIEDAIVVCSLQRPRPGVVVACPLTEPGASFPPYVRGMVQTLATDDNVNDNDTGSEMTMTITLSSSSSSLSHVHHMAIGIAGVRPDADYLSNRLRTHLNRHWFRYDSLPPTSTTRGGALVKMAGDVLLDCLGYDRADEVGWGRASGGIGSAAPGRGDDGDGDGDDGDEEQRAGRPLGVCAFLLELDDGASLRRRPPPPDAGRDDHDHDEEDDEDDHGRPTPPTRRLLAASVVGGRGSSSSSSSWSSSPTATVARRSRRIRPWRSAGDDDDDDCGGAPRRGSEGGGVPTSSSSAVAVVGAARGDGDDDDDGLKERRRRGGRGVAIPPVNLSRAIVIPNNVRAIGELAFNYCTRLTRVTLGSGLEEIGAGAFANCTSLEEIVIPPAVRAIEEGAFYNCTRLTRVTLGSGLEEIEWGAFNTCESMKEIVIPNNVRAGEDWGIVIPDAVRDIHDTAFKGCTNLTRVKFCDEIEEFVSCDAMKDVTPAVGSGTRGGEDAGGRVIVLVTPIKRLLGKDSIDGDDVVDNDDAGRREWTTAMTTTTTIIIIIPADNANDVRKEATVRFSQRGVAGTTFDKRAHQPPRPSYLWVVVVERRGGGVLRRS
ncbi:hypothetical protein ACHAW5_003484 [Stephanodiscus triporus]|uniref:Uncharacterized protein n=1 Tax=Stephanodiscus triporus TaxID=2934178 RepID=A0ABD3QVI2_9STRA